MSEPETNQLLATHGVALEFTVLLLEGLEFTSLMTNGFELLPLLAVAELDFVFVPALVGLGLVFALVFALVVCTELTPALGEAGVVLALVVGFEFALFVVGPGLVLGAGTIFAALVTTASASSYIR